jgi:hypothetical protein
MDDENREKAEKTTIRGVMEGHVGPEDLIRVNVHDLARWILELRAAREQVTELQDRGRELLEENRKWKAYGSPESIEAFVQGNIVDTSDGFTNEENLRIGMYRYFGLDDSALPR